jgi:hypothetical protein
MIKDKVDMIKRLFIKKFKSMKVDGIYEMKSTMPVGLWGYISPASVF